MRGKVCFTGGLIKEVWPSRPNCRIHGAGLRRLKNEQSEIPLHFCTAGRLGCRACSNVMNTQKEALTGGGKQTMSDGNKSCRIKLSREVGKRGGFNEVVRERLTEELTLKQQPSDEGE